MADLLVPLLEHLLRMAGAFALALPIAWERERETRLLGLRTFPLVALASCAYMLLATRAFADSSEAQARAVQGVITGIGFIGGGAILKGQGSVRGTATAASIWATGALGAAAAYGEWTLAVVLSGVTFVVLRFLTPFTRRVREAADEPTLILPAEGKEE